MKLLTSVKNSTSIFFLKLIKIYLMMRDKNKKNIFIEKKT